MLVGAASSPDSIRAKRSPSETGAPNPLMNEDCTFGDARPRKFQVLHTGKAVLLIIGQSPGLLFCDLILNRPIVILTTPLIPLLSGMAESDVLSSGDGISRLLHEEEERLKAVRLFRQPLIYVQT